MDIYIYDIIWYNTYINNKSLTGRKKGRNEKVHTKRIKNVG
jgi:hypothetical protein